MQRIMSDDEKASLLRKFQWDMLEVVKYYKDKGVACNDQITLILNLASILAITSELTIVQTVEMLEKVFDLAKSDKLAPNLN